MSGRLVRRPDMQWLPADYAEKRSIIEIPFLNSRLTGLTLGLSIRKPFNLLAEGQLLEKEWSYGDLNPKFNHAMVA